MDSNGFKAMAFLQFYLCGVVAVFSGYYDGPAAFATIIASSVMLTTCVLSALWIHEWRDNATTQEPRAFAPGAARAAVIIGWMSLALSAATQSVSTVYGAYIAVLVLLLYRARSMEAEENGGLERMRLEM